VLGPVLVGLVLTGCSSGTSSGGPAMMSPGSQYHSSRLTCAAPSSLPGRTVAVSMGDMGMTSMMAGTASRSAQMRLQARPTTEPAGQISFVAANTGWRTHELVILPLAGTTAAGLRTPRPDGKVSETGSLGEASRSCAGGAGSGITSGAVGWVTVRLKPGRYELLCNLPNHYADGMHQELVIT
jgi:uncharacterized cupredoxin-like copper-binding protein